MLLKNISLLACKRKLQDFCLSQNNFVISQIHFASLGCSPTKPKTHAIWVRKESLRWVLLTNPWFNFLNYLWTCFISIFGCFIFLGFFVYKKKIQKHWKFSKRQNILFWVLFYFPWGLHELWYLSLDLEHAWYCGDI